MTKKDAENIGDSLVKLSAMLKIFYDSLIAVGFDDAHAMYITVEFMKNTTNKPAAGKNTHAPA